MDGLAIGGGYEFGLSQSGQLGMFNDESTFEMYAINGYLAYYFQMKGVAPYLKVGGGQYNYTQTITSGSPPSSEITGNKVTFFGGVGLKFMAGNSGAICLEALYVPLKVNPAGQEVDLTTIRAQGGISFAF